MMQLERALMIRFEHSKYARYDIFVPAADAATIPFDEGSKTVLTRLEELGLANEIDDFDKKMMRMPRQALVFVVTVLNIDGERFQLQKFIG